MKNLIAYVLLLAYLCCHNLAIGQVPYSKKTWDYKLESELNFEITSWTTSDGLPQNTINAILQDNEGFIWVFTNEGIARFDGTHFEKFDNKTNPNLYGSRFEDACLGNNGIIWASSSDGYLVKLHNGLFTSYKLPNFLQVLQGLELDESGNPLICVSNQLYCFRNNEFKLVKDFEDVMPGVHNFAYNSESKTAYFATSGGLFTFHDGTTSNYKDDERIIYIKNLSSDSVLFTNGIEYFIIDKNREIHSISGYHENLRSTGRVGIRDRNGSFWLSIVNGLYVMNQGGNSNLITPNEGLSSHNVRSLFEDKNGNIWVGTDNMGLSLIRPKLFEKFPLPSTYSGESIVGLNLESDSVFWIAPSCKGAIRVDLKEGEISHVSLNNPNVPYANDAEGGGCAWNIHKDMYGNMWIGSYGSSITMVSPDKKKYQYSKGNTTDIHTNTNLSFCQLSSRKLAVGSYDGVRVFDYKTSTFTHLKDSLSYPSVLTNAIKQVGDTLWFTTNRGVLMYDGERLHQFNSENNNIDQNNFRYIYQDQAGRMWFGSYGGGLYLWQGDTLASLTKENGLYDNVVSWIAEYDGKYWITCNSGIFAIDSTLLVDYFKGKRTGIECSHYGHENGLEVDEFNGGFQNTGFIYQNRFFLPSVDGLVIFNPNSVPEYSISSAIVTQILIDGIPLHEVRPFRLNYNFKRLEFQTASPIFNNEQNIILEYLIDGFDEEWILIDDDKTISFTTLNPGDYTLNIRTRKVGSDSGYINSYKFTVLAPFWLQPSFYILVVILSLLLIIGIWRFANHRTRTRQQELQVLVTQKSRELELSRSNILALIENTDDIIFSVDESGKLIEANDNYLNLIENKFGFTLQKGNNILDKIPAKNREVWEPHFKRALKGRKFQVRIDNGKKGKHMRSSEVYFNPIFKENNNVDGFVCVTKDITDLIKKQKDLEIARQKALQSAQSKSEFLATMSHEIRTPLNGVLGMTSLLQSTELTKEQQQFIRTIRMSGDSLMTIINEILDFSKLDAGKITLEEQPFELSQVVDETIELNASRANAKGIQVIQLIHPDTPNFVNGDITRLRQVLLNLVSNAIKFTETGSVTIELSSTPIDDIHESIEFKVTDTGIGMTDKQKNNLFKPFSQGDTSTTRKYGGTGLGLAISKRLVLAMNGDIRLDSELGKGTTFTCTLPLKKTDENKHAKPQIPGTLCVVNADEHEFNMISYFAKRTGIELSTYERFEFDQWKTYHDAGSIVSAIVFGGKTSGDIRELIHELEDMRLSPKSMLYLAVGNDFPEILSKSEITRPLYLPLTFKSFKSAFCEEVDEFYIPQNKVEDIPKLAERYPFNILIVEDNLINQRLAHIMLQKMGYDCDMVANGEEAVNAIEVGNYSLIFMDMQMPVMDGLEASMRIRKNKQIKQPTIIALTANAMSDDRERCMRAGMDDYLSKPITLESLSGMIIKLGNKVYA